MQRLLPFLFLLAACAEAPAEMPPHDAEADALLAHVTGDAWDTAWATADSGAYRQPDGQPLDGLPVNPLPAFLSDEPPYLDASAR